MGYAIPIVCKEIYLPLPAGEEVTFEEYHEKYGIDLTEFIKLVGNEISFDFGLNKVYLVNTPEYKSITNKTVIDVVQPNYSKTTGYVSGETTGETIIAYSDRFDLQESAIGFTLRINADEEFSIENIKIIPFIL